MKNYWEQWEWRLWLSDPNLSMCQAATRGVWMDALCAMMERGTDRLTGTPEQLAQVCRCPVSVLLSAVEDLGASNAATIEKQNGSISIVCRKRSRELEIKEKRAKAGRIGGSKHKANSEAKEDCPLIVTVTSSSSSTPEGMQGEAADKPQQPKAKTETDADFWASLKPLYPGVDIEREHRKMQAWLLTPAGRGRKLTRRFVVNWLGRCDATVAAPDPEELRKRNMAVLALGGAQ